MSQQIRAVVTDETYQLLKHACSGEGRKVELGKVIDAAVQAYLGTHRVQDEDTKLDVVLAQVAHLVRLVEGAVGASGAKEAEETLPEGEDNGEVGDEEPGAGPGLYDFDFGEEFGVPAPSQSLKKSGGKRSRLSRLFLKD